VRGEVHTRVLWVNLRERPLGRPRHRWKEHKKRICKAWDGSMDRIGLAENMDRWYALVNVIMNICVSKNTGVS
jgi:hypothetical protein